MKVICKSTNEIKDVSFGYAVNYLLPKGLAVVANEENLKLLEKQREELNYKKEEKEKEDKLLAQKLRGKKIVIKRKVGKSKKIFGSVTKKDIIKSLELAPQRVEIELKKPIKKLGLYKIELKIGKEKFIIKVEVVGE